MDSNETQADIPGGSARRPAARGPSSSFERSQHEIVRILRRAHRNEIDIGDLLSAALMEMAAKVGGPHEVIKFRSGSWEAEHVLRLAGGY